MKYTPDFIAEQTQYLKSLIAYDRPMELLDTMDKIGWDFDVFYLATLYRSDIIAILERFLRRDLTVGQVISWANSFDGRPSVEFELPYTQVISRVISILANCIDENSFLLTAERAEALIQQLKYSEPDKAV